MTTAAYISQLAQYNAYIIYTNEYTTYTNRLVNNPADPGPAPTPVPFVAKPWRSERTYEVRGIFSLTRVSNDPLLK